MMFYFSFEPTEAWVWRSEFTNVKLGRMKKKIPDWTFSCSNLISRVNLDDSFAENLSALQLSIKCHIYEALVTVRNCEILTIGYCWTRLQMNISELGVI